MAPSGTSYRDFNARLSGCAATEELKENFVRWIESQKPRADAASLPMSCQKRLLRSHRRRSVVPQAEPKETSKRRPRPMEAARKLQRSFKELCQCL
jgi:hypothetical protein